MQVTDCSKVVDAVLQIGMERQKLLKQMKAAVQKHDVGAVFEVATKLCDEPEAVHVQTSH